MRFQTKKKIRRCWNASVGHCGFRRSLVFLSVSFCCGPVITNCCSFFFFGPISGSCPCASSGFLLFRAAAIVGRLSILQNVGRSSKKGKKNQKNQRKWEGKKNKKKIRPGSVSANRIRVASGCLRLARVKWIDRRRFEWFVCFFFWVAILIWGPRYLDRSSIVRWNISGVDFFPPFFFRGWCLQLGLVLLSDEITRSHLLWFKLRLVWPRCQQGGMGFTDPNLIFIVGT